MSRSEFVVKEGTRLMLGGKPFRFAGPNVYWLGLDENTGGIEWPTAFRVLDALDTAKEMGATVVRAHTLGISVGNPKSAMPALGVWNEEALRRIDFAVREAGKRGLRLIVPLVDNWDYYHGGLATFLRWRGLTERSEFYANPDVIADYKAYIAGLVNRVNAYSGVAYKDDPTIVAWQLGNELNDVPIAWAEEIAAYIRGLDGNHLIAHGQQHELDEDKLHAAHLDILDVHYYPANADKLLADARKVTGAGKVYIAGEYGWPQGDLERFLGTAEAEEIVSGTCFWSLFPHADDGGYVHHFDGFTVHYPGTGLGGDLPARIARLREHAYRMRGEATPPSAVPTAPVIERAGREIVFRGTVGAAAYTLEKSTAGADGPWEVVFDRRPSAYGGPWIDAERAMITRTWYRIKAWNADGVAGEFSEAYESEAFR